MSFNNYANDPLCPLPPNYYNLTDFTCAGSGLLLLYSNYSSHDTVSTGGHNQSTISIVGSVFSNNAFDTPEIYAQEVKNAFRFPIETTLPVVGGTGLSIWSSQESDYFVNVSIRDCKFSHNTGYYGSLTFTSINTIKEISVSIEDCDFYDNEAFEIGAGMVISVLTFPEKNFVAKSLFGCEDDIHMMVTVENSRFFNNSAGNGAGGGLYMLITPTNAIDVDFVIRGVSFINNTARTGYAILAEGLPEIALSSTDIGILLEDIDVVNNQDNSLTFRQRNNLESSDVQPPRQSNAAVFCSFIGNVTIFGDKKVVNFTSNYPGALVVIEGNLHLRGKSVFAYNLAYRGGAINLVRSLLFFKNNSATMFTRNNATSLNWRCDKFGL